MAFTRSQIRNLAKESGVELPKEFEDALIAEHITARDAYAEEQVKQAGDAAKTNAPKVEDTEEYKNLKQQFEDYKAEVAAEKTDEAKEAAFRALLTEAEIDPKCFNTVIRVEKSGFGELKLDKDGKFEGADELLKRVKADWADFGMTTTTTGVPLENPPKNNGGGKTVMTKADIMKIKDASERQTAIAENIQLFK